jgi:L-alanine-DL-glutamate epimerase-like enolase superfamily enzyme
MAISAVDVALWDLKAKVLNLPLLHLLGSYKEKIPVYGSGGFTNYSQEQMEKQLSGWLAQGIRMVKIKIGTHPDKDSDRVKFAKKIIGKDNQLFVDANGAYSKKQAMNLSYSFAEENVSWFEEPVSSDDIDGLRFLTEHVPAPINIASGEYGYDIFYFKRLLENKAVDILQADATRCGGITGFLKVASLSEAFNVPLSSHCVPYLHLPLVCSLRQTIHSEYFFDHARIEETFFDGTRQPENGFLIPDLSKPGLGLDFKKNDAEKFLVRI